MKRFAAVVFGLIVLAVPYVVAAECAFVLWMVAPDGEKRFVTKPMATFRTLEECLDVAGPSNESSRRAAKTEAFRCFPDTIDPRGPKATTR